MAQNIIVKDRNNPIIINFTGVDLTLLDDIKVKFGDDERTLLLNATSVIVNSATELELNFQDTVETKANILCITGFDSNNLDGLLFTAANFNPLDVVIIIDGVC